MSAVIDDTNAPYPSEPGLLAKERTIAGAGFNRWLVPPAALAIHLCIGMAYGFSVFWLPLSKAIGVNAAVSCGKDVTFFSELFTTTCDWRIATLGWMYTLFFVFLGCSAALWGGWLERVGPRKAGVVSACCWCGGMLLSALGIYLHQFWLMILGSGVIGGIGLGLGYISPVSTLIKWFPDRRGMATGMAIMGFGGGAMIGSPLAADLIKYFSTPTDVGVMQTFVVMGLIYFVFMIGGAFGYRIPPTGWKPAGWTAPAAITNNAMITQKNVHVKRVWGIPQFWLVWMVLTHERQRRHRRDRHGQPDAAGGVRRQPDRHPEALRRARQGAAHGDRRRRRRLRGAAQPVQHRRPLLLGQPVGQARPQDDLHRLLRPRRPALRQHSGQRRGRQQAAVRGRLLHHPQHVRRRLRHRARLPRRPVRHADGGRHPRPAPHRLGHGRHPRPGGRELHARVPARPRAFRASRSTTRPCSSWSACSSSA